VPRINIAEMQTGQMIDQVFLLARRDIRSARNNTLYLAAELADRSGSVSAKMWNLNEAAAKRLPDVGPVRARGRVDSYQGANQVLIDNIQWVELSEEEAAELLPRSPHDPEEMFAELVEIMGAVTHPDLRALLDAFLADADKMRRLRLAPAAMHMHQPYLGGLLEHTLSVAKLARDCLPRFDVIDMNLMLTAVFLHDIGKIDELAYAGAFDYTDRGRLVGHLIIAVEWLGEKIRQLDAERDEPFPDDLKMVLEHLILAHHGEHEYGSPKLPMTAEAIALHFLDNMDAKLFRFGYDVANDADPTSTFTQKSYMFGRRLYKRRVLDGDKPQ